MDTQYDGAREILATQGGLLWTFHLSKQIRHLIYHNIWMHSAPLRAYQVNGTGICRGNVNMLEDNVLVTTSFISVMWTFETGLLVFLHNSKSTIPGQDIIPVVTAAFLFILFCVHAPVSSGWQGMVHSEWWVFGFATLSRIALQERVGDI